MDDVALQARAPVDLDLTDDGDNPALAVVLERLLDVGVRIDGLTDATTRRRDHEDRRRELDLRDELDRRETDNRRLRTDLDETTAELRVAETLADERYELLLSTQQNLARARAGFERQSVAERIERERLQRRLDIALSSMGWLSRRRWRRRLDAT